MTIHVGRNTVVILGLVATGAIMLTLVWGVSLGSILWVVLVLACPLIMMHGHRDGADHTHEAGNDRYPRGVQ